MMLIRPLMTNLKMTVREDLAVSECSPFPLSIKALAYWLAVEGGISLWIESASLPRPPEIRQTFLSTNLASLLVFEWRVARPHFQLHWDLGDKHCARYWGEKEEWGRCPMLVIPCLTFRSFSVLLCALRRLIPTAATTGLPGLWILAGSSQRGYQQMIKGGGEKDWDASFLSSSSPILVGQGLFLLLLATAPARQPLCSVSSSCWILVTLPCPCPSGLEVITVSHCNKALNTSSPLVGMTHTAYGS